MSRMKDGVIRRGQTWSYVIRELDPQTGKTKPKWFGGFATQRAAKTARAEALTAMSRGTYVSRSTITVREYLETWMDGHEVELKPSTVNSYRAKIDTYLIPAIGHEKLQDLSPGRLSAVFKTMAAEGGKGAKNGRGGRALSPRTVEFARAVLRRAMQDAVLDRVIDVNPVIGTKRPRQIKPEHTTWAAEQVQAFLAAAEYDRLHPLWLLAASTGMRRGELLALRWRDIDFDGSLARVERSVTQIRQDRVYTTPKNHEKRRVGLDAATLQALRSWKTDQARERLAAGGAWADEEGLLFTWEDGSPLLPDYVTKRFPAVQRAHTELQLPTITVHELRHSHATILLRAGVPVHIVSKRLGHKDVTVTLNVYADVIPQDDDRAVEVFASAVWGA